MGSSLRALMLILGPLTLCACATTGPRWNPHKVPIITVPTGASRYHFECNAPAGREVRWYRPVYGRALAVSGTIRMEKFMNDPRWFSLAAIVLFIGSHRTITLRIEELDLGSFGVLLIDSDQPRSEHIVGTMPIYPKPLRFYLALTPDSLLHVAVGEVRGSMRLKGALPTGVGLGCSTARLLFSNVVISTRASSAGAPDHET